MVRRGSTVRVRQRALQKPRKRGFLVQIELRLIVCAVGVEHVVEQSVSEGARSQMSKAAKRPLSVLKKGNARVREPECRERGMDVRPVSPRLPQPIETLPDEAS